MTKEEVIAQAQEQAAKDMLQRPPEVAQPQGPQYGVSNVTPEVGFMGKYVIPAVAPTVGGMAGAAMGGVPGSAVGSMVGEGLNQMMGITDPSLRNIGLAGALPLAAGAAGNAFRMGKQFFGARGAQTLNAIAPEEAAMAVAKLEPSIKSRFLFESATESGATIAMKRTASAVDDMLDDLTQSSKGIQQANRTVINYLKGLKEKITASPNGLSPKDLQRELAGNGAIIQTVKAKGGAGSGAVKNIFKAMSNDLDEVANLADDVGSESAMLLKEARNTFKKETAVSEIREAIETAVKTLRGQGDQPQFNANLVMKELKNNDFIKQAFSPAEVKEMEGIFSKLNKIPALRPGAGQQAGSFRVLQGPAMGGALGAAGGIASGMGPGAGSMLGAAAGVVVPPMAEMAQNFALAMSMKTGRALIGQLLKNSAGELTPQAMSIVAAYAQAVNAGAESAVAGQ